MIKKHAVDSAAHIAWAFIALIPVLLWPGIIGGALSGLVFALPRELIDQGPFRIGWSRALDLAGFAAGGALAGFLWG